MSITNPTRQELIEAHTSKRNWLSEWFPVISDLAIPIPKTILVRLDKKDALNWLFSKRSLPASFLVEFQTAAKSIGYPVFIRTDECSGKFEWASSCYVEKEERLIRNLQMVLEANEEADLMGLDYAHIAVREYLAFPHKLTAYNGMPVGQEYRFFAKDGEYICHHPYWYEKILEDRMNSHHPALPTNWKTHLQQTYPPLSEKDLVYLKWTAQHATKTLGGYWSIDFLHARDQWWLTDCALGLSSHHKEDCDNRVRVHLTFGRGMELVPEEPT